MTLSVSTQVSPVANRLVVDDAVGATAKNNVLGAAGTLFMVDVDNEANPGAICYLKIADAVTAVPGTTDPQVVVMIPAGQRRSVVWPEGVALATGLTFWCVTSPGTPGVTAPTNPVVARIVASA
jgi:hypothetical protein